MSSTELSANARKLQEDEIEVGNEEMIGVGREDIHAGVMVVFRDW